LPLSSSDFAGNGVLVIGPTATATYTGGGGSAHVTPFEPITNALTALRTAAGSGTVNYVQGYDLDGQLVPSSAVTVPGGTSVMPGGLPPADAGFAGQNGWLRQQVSTTVPASGSEPAACVGTCAADQVDPTVNYTSNTSTLPAGTAWRWTTHFTVPAAPAGSNSWQLKVFVKNQSANGAQLFVDGLANSPNRRVNIGEYGVASGGIGGSAISAWDGLAQANKSHDGLELQQAAYTATFAAGETHELDIRAYANSTAPLSVQFKWVPPDWQAQSIAAATAAASTWHAKKVVIFAYDDGAEGNDRGNNDQNAGLQLPGWQDTLISAVAAVNPNVAVVLNTGDPVYMPWLSSVKSVLEMWYPGVAGGVATADILTGAANPSGKLPMTFPDGSASRPRFPTDDPGCNPSAIVTPNNSTGLGANDGNCPLYPGVFLSNPTQGPHTYKTIDMTTNGIFQGYKWYDKNAVTPLFPFGYGLSYTSFAYSGLSVAPTATGLDVTFTVQNTGSVAGTEVAQVYVGPPDNPPVPMAVKSLVGFERVPLAPGESKQLTIHVDKRGLSYWSTATHDWQLASNNRTVFIGSSSRNIRLEESRAFAFSSASYSVNEGGGTASVTINRTGPASGSDSIHFATANGTATAGSDYTAVDQTVTFAAGETSKTVSVPVTDDSSIEGNETVQLSLSSPSAGVMLGSPSTATLTIVDNDRAFAFSSATYSVGEASGHATVKINRTGLTSGSDSVHFATAHGTAKAGSDYKTLNQTVTFAAGETSKTVSVRIIRNTVHHANKTVRLSLSGPSAGVTLGSPHTATLTIRDDDNGRLASARLTKKSFGSSLAGKVKLICTFSPRSTSFARVLSVKKGTKWIVVKRARGIGSFKTYTRTVKELFGPKRVKSGLYQLKLSANVNGKVLRFRVR